MQKVTAFVDDRGKLRQCPSTVTVALVDALTRSSSPVVVVQSDDGIVSQIPLQDCTHATLIDDTLYLFDKDNTRLVLLFQSKSQATKFADGMDKHVRFVGPGGIDIKKALHNKEENSEAERDHRVQILTILKDPSFPEYVDAVEKILCHMVVAK